MEGQGEILSIDEEAKNTLLDFGSESMVLETNSLFGSTNSSIFMSNLHPIAVYGEDGGINIKSVSSGSVERKKLEFRLYLCSSQLIRNEIMLSKFVNMLKFYPNLIGLTGRPDEIKKAARAYRVYYMKTEEEDSDYLVDHSIIMYVLHFMS